MELIVREAAIIVMLSYVTFARLFDLLTGCLQRIQNHRDIFYNSVTRSHYKKISLFTLMLELTYFYRLPSNSHHYIRRNRHPLLAFLKCLLCELPRMVPFAFASGVQKHAAELLVGAETLVGVVAKVF